MLVVLLSECMRGDIRGSVLYPIKCYEFLLKQHLLFMEQSLGRLLLRNFDCALPSVSVSTLVLHAVNMIWVAKEQSPLKELLKLPRISMLGVYPAQCSAITLQH